ncbi:TEA domain-containing protein [Mycena sanguinolenta]|uniref:TEA domain-containing protein n=1 Tax=Mycena sanguinolenta TaxID=230812 RepID=A0A8H7DG12_9AGAR|nr:TEA domain-containing protein [Mycena sanguinolenta]
MYWNNNQEWLEEIASTRSSTPPTLSQSDTMYLNSNCGWAEESISTRSSMNPVLNDMYWSNNFQSSQATVPIGCSVPTRSADYPHGPSCHTSWSIRGGQMAMDVFQSVLNVHKSWKTLPGGEAVWPPALEAALIEGLEHYQPDDCRETRVLGRFPMRNCFIAEYIFRTTGKRRSAKQVGSRLQQIRDSCRDEKLLRLLSHMPQRTHAGAFAPNNNFPSLNQASPNISSIRHTAVHINILPDGATEESNHLQTEAEVSVRPPCRISSINPTVAFSSSSLIEAESRSAVYVAGRIVHTETTPLTLVAPGHSSGFIYSTTLVPNYWEVISRHSDPTRFIVCQEVFKGVESTLIFSGTYTFEYPTGDSCSSPSSVDPNFDRCSDHLVPTAPTQEFGKEGYPLYVPPE